MTVIATYNKCNGSYKGSLVASLADKPKHIRSVAALRWCKWVHLHPYTHLPCICCSHLGSIESKIKRFKVQVRVVKMKRARSQIHGQGKLTGFLAKRLDS